VPPGLLSAGHVIILTPFFFHALAVSEPVRRIVAV